MEHRPAEPVLPEQLEKMESYIFRNGMAGSDIGTSTQVRLQQGRRCLWVVLFLSHNARCDDSSLSLHLHSGSFMG